MEVFCLLADLSLQNKQVNLVIIDSVK